MNVVFILIGRRTEEAVKVQTVLSDFGDVIRTRLGINRELTQENDASGFIFLELCGDEKRGQDLCNALNAIPDVKAECLKIELPGCSCGCQG
ncbi:MAG TPA: hypothetical protein VN426_16475 [Syntrophomonadaceae bacterium]|nr:hypothetical protein [Syntrophomonadaceae bacterium]